MDARRATRWLMRRDNGHADAGFLPTLTDSIRQHTLQSSHAQRECHG